MIAIALVRWRRFWRRRRLGVGVGVVGVGVGRGVGETVGEGDGEHVSTSEPLLPMNMSLVVTDDTSQHRYWPKLEA